MGVIPVVSRVSGVDDLVEEDVSGLLVPPGDETALATRLGEALSMTSRSPPRYGRGGTGGIRARFSLDAIAERHVTLYRKLIDAEQCAKA